MRLFFKILSALIGFFVIFFLHIFCINVLPFPFNRLDIIFVTVWWGVCHKNHSAQWWSALFLGLLTELFASSPFGLATLSLLLSLYTGRWLMQNVFTSHAWPVVLISALASLTVYHIVFLLLLAVHHIIYGVPVLLNGPYLAGALYGMLLTMAILTARYFFDRLANKQRAPYYIGY